MAREIIYDALNEAAFTIFDSFIYRQFEEGADPDDIEVDNKNEWFDLMLIREGFREVDITELKAVIYAKASKFKKKGKLWKNG